MRWSIGYEKNTWDCSLAAQMSWHFFSADSLKDSSKNVQGTVVQSCMKSSLISQEITPPCRVPFWLPIAHAQPPPLCRHHHRTQSHSQTFAIDPHHWSTLVVGSAAVRRCSRDMLPKEIRNCCLQGTTLAKILARTLDISPGEKNKKHLHKSKTRQEAPESNELADQNSKLNYMLTRLVASNFSDPLDHCTNVLFGHAPKANHGTGGVGEANNAGTSPTSSTCQSAQARFVVNQLALGPTQWHQVTNAFYQSIVKGVYPPGFFFTCL